MDNIELSQIEPELDEGKEPKSEEDDLIKNIYRTVCSLVQHGGISFADSQLLLKLKKSPKLCKALVTNEKDPDDPHTSGMTMLHLACQEGLLKCVKYLNKLNPQTISHLSTAQWTPLMQACEAGHKPVIRYLCEGQAELLLNVTEHGSAMHSAITGQNPLEIVKILVDLINQQESVTLIVPETPFHDSDESTKKLVNLADKSGVRPLYLACHTGDTKTVSFLLKCGADPWLARTREASVLHVCAERDFQEICQLIVEVAPKQLLYELDSEKNTALHTAAEWDN